MTPEEFAGLEFGDRVTADEVEKVVVIRHDVSTSQVVCIRPSGGQLWVDSPERLTLGWPDDQAPQTANFAQFIDLISAELVFSPEEDRDFKKAAAVVLKDFQSHEPKTPSAERLAEVIGAVWLNRTWRDLTKEPNDHLWHIDAARAVLKEFGK